MENRSSSLPILIRYAHPWSLLAGVLFYSLGISIVKYLGHPILWDRLWLALGMIVMLQLSSYFLKAHFDLVDAANPLRRLQNDTPKDDQQALDRLPKQGVLILSITTLTAGAVLTVVMVTAGAINLPTLIILGLAFLLAFFYAVPPIRLVYSGYGELTEAILIAGLIPAFAFLIQTAELHRFLLILSFPMVALYLAMRIALSFESYALDLKLAHKSLLIAIGWQRALVFHNILIPITYLLLGFGGLAGFPWSLTWPGLLTIPIGIFQMWQINQIGAGAKPAWRLLRLTASSLIGLSVYLISLAFITG